VYSYFCDSYGSGNQKRLFLPTKLTEWFFYNREEKCLLQGRNWILYIIHVIFRLETAKSWGWKKLTGLRTEGNRGKTEFKNLQHFLITLLKCNFLMNVPHSGASVVCLVESTDTKFILVTYMLGASFDEIQFQRTIFLSHFLKL
jgi:hypothetical protein